MQTDAFPRIAPAYPAAAPLTAPPRFFHITSPAAALAILRSRTFHGTPAGKAGAGVTGWLDGQADTGNPAQCGAILHFVWRGPIEPRPSGMGTPDTLYDERPARVFVPAGTRRHLRLVAVVLQDGHHWTEGLAATGRPMGRDWLNPMVWRDWLQPAAAMARREQELAAEVADLVARQPFIVVAPYRVHNARA